MLSFGITPLDPNKYTQAKDKAGVCYNLQKAPAGKDLQISSINKQMKT